MVGVTLRLIPMMCLVGLFVILGGNVISRYYQIWSIAWFDEIVEGLFAWMVFIGAAALWREHNHFRITWLDTKLRGELLPRLHTSFVSVISIAFFAVLTWKGWLLTTGSGTLSPILGVPTALFYVSIPISGTVMLIYSLVDLLKIFQRLPPAIASTGPCSVELEVQEMEKP